MKKRFQFITILLLLSATLFAQSPPQAISWQTVVRMPDGSLVQNQFVSVRFDIHQGTANGAVVYSETHSDTTDEFGLLNLHLSAGSPVLGQFDTIDWGNGPYFTEVLVDPAGGSNYVSTGAQQMLSVPYALYAGSAGGNWSSIDDDVYREEGSVGIGTGNIDTTAVLEVSSTSQGVLFPRLTTIQRDAIANPAEGLMIYNTDVGAIQIYVNGSWGSVVESTSNLFSSVSGGCLSLGGYNNEESYDSTPTADGGYAVVGRTESIGSGGSDVYIGKFNSVGVLDWAISVGGPLTEYGESIIQSNDGGFVVVGFTYSFGAGSSDVYVAKISSSGELLWSKTYGGTGPEAGESIVQTSDLGYLICGQSSSFIGAGSGDIYVIKIDGSGTLQWSKTIGGQGAETAYSAVNTSDGGYALCGSTTSVGAGSSDVLLLKLASDGSVQWSRVFGGSEIDQCFKLVETPDGGYCVAGHSASFSNIANPNAFAMKFSSSGLVSWARMFVTGTNLITRSRLRALSLTSDNGIIYSGQIDPQGLFVLKTNLNGSIIWTKTFKSINGNDSSIGELQGGSYVATGDGGNLQFGAGGLDVTIVKLDQQGKSCCSTGSHEYEELIGGTLTIGAFSSLDVTSAVSSGGAVVSGGTVNVQCGQ